MSTIKPEHLGIPGLIEMVTRENYLNAIEYLEANPPDVSALLHLEQALRDSLRETVWHIHLDEPVHVMGTWTLSISHLIDQHNAQEAYSVEVEYRPTTSRTDFGISAGPRLSFGAGVDEVWHGFDATLMRIMYLLHNRLPTTPGCRG